MVAIKAHEADRALARLDPACCVILLYGPDSGLVSERAAAVAKRAVDDPLDCFQMVRIDGDSLASDPARLLDEANTIGLFGGRRALRVSATSRPLLSAVSPLLATPPIDALVVIEAGELQRTNPLRLACEKSPHALAIPCYGDTGRDLGSIIDDIIQKAGKRIARPVRDVLAASLGNDRLVSRQEIEKLVLYCGTDPEIGIEHVTAVIGDSSAREIDTLVDAVFLGQTSLIDVTLSKLSGEGVDGNAILASLLRHVLGLLKSRTAFDNGRTLKESAALMRGIPYPRQAAVENAVRNWSATRLQDAVLLLGQTSAQLRKDSELGRIGVTRTLWTLSRQAVSSRPESKPTR